jgi:hypothetical protein
MRLPKSTHAAAVLHRWPVKPTVCLPLRSTPSSACIQTLLPLAVLTWGPYSWSPTTEVRPAAPSAESKQPPLQSCTATKTAAATTQSLCVLGCIHSQSSTRKSFWGSFRGHNKTADTSQATNTAAEGQRPHKAAQAPAQHNTKTTPTPTCSRPITSVPPLGMRLPLTTTGNTAANGQHPHKRAQAPKTTPNRPAKVRKTPAHPPAHAR